MRLRRSPSERSAKRGCFRVRPGHVPGIRWGHRSTGEKGPGETALPPVTESPPGPGPAFTLREGTLPRPGEIAVVPGEEDLSGDTAFQPGKSHSHPAV